MYSNKQTKIKKQRIEAKVVWVQSMKVSLPSELTKRAKYELKLTLLSTISCLRSALTLKQHYTSYWLPHVSVFWCFPARLTRVLVSVSQIEVSASLFVFLLVVPPSLCTGRIYVSTHSLIYILKYILYSFQRKVKIYDNKEGVTKNVEMARETVSKIQII